MANGKTALITGAGSGIGAETAALLVARGYRVIAAGRRMERLTALAERLGKDCLPVTLDVADAASVKSLPDRLPKDWGPVDVLINSAGHDVGGRVRYDLGAMEDWESTIEVNLIGAMRVTRVFLPSMMEHKRGDIVMVSSLSARRATPTVAAYTASKFGMHGFAEALRADFKGSALRVTEIQLGPARTEFAEARWRGDKDRAEAFYSSLSGYLQPEDIAQSIVWALEQPPGVTIGEIVVMPTGMAL